MTKRKPAHLVKANRNKPGHPGHWYAGIQKKFLKDNEAVPRRELTALFNKRFHCAVTVVNIKSWCTRHGLKTGRTGRFFKGQVSHNKGQRGMVKPNSGQFKKGNIPQNHLPIGTEIMRHGDCIWRKIAEPNVWRQKHHLHWERYRGPIPDGKMIRFKDGDPTNICMANFELITRSLHVRYNKNRVNEYPSELRETVKAYSQIQEQAGKLKRKRKDKSRA